MSHFTNATFLETIIWFYVIPSVYLSFRLRPQIKKAAFFALTGTIIGMVFEYSAEVTKTWVFPHSAFPTLIFGLSPIEVPLWLFFWMYFIVMFYEYYLEKDRRVESSRSLIYTLFSAAVLVFVWVCLLPLTRQTLAVPYTYLSFGFAIGLLPLALCLWNFPKLAGKIFFAGIYFFYSSLIYEIVGLGLNIWDFPTEGQFIGWVNLFGFSFPFEEFFFWITLGSMGILAVYEFFDDDRK